MHDREHGGREASPTAAVLDNQTVKRTESGGVRGYDAGEKIKGRKRHAIVDTDGRAVDAGLAGKLALCGAKLRQYRLRRAARRKRPFDPHRGGAQG